MPAFQNKQGPGILNAIQKLLNEGQVGVLVTLVDAHEQVGAKILLTGSGELLGSFGDPKVDTAIGLRAADFLGTSQAAHVFAVKEFAPELSSWSEARCLFERIQQEPRLVICGAGHVGAALAKLAHALNYQVTLIDDRAEFLKREGFPLAGIELVKADNWADAVITAVGNGRGVAVAVVTRGHNEDEECLRATLQTDPDYVGLIGSKRRTNIVLERLREAGIADTRLRRVHAPVGLDIGAVTPEEVALAILAEVVAERRGGQGGSLSAWRRG